MCVHFQRDANSPKALPHRDQCRRTSCAAASDLHVFTLSVHSAAAVASTEDLTRQELWCLTAAHCRPYLVSLEDAVLSRVPVEPRGLLSFMSNFLKGAEKLNRSLSVKKKQYVKKTQCIVFLLFSLKGQWMLQGPVFKTTYWKTQVANKLPD